MPTYFPVRLSHPEYEVYHFFWTSERENSHETEPLRKKRHFHDGKMNIQRKPDYRGEVEVSYSAFSCVRSVSGLVWKLSQNAHLWLTPHSSKEFVALKELANLALSAP